MPPLSFAQSAIDVVVFQKPQRYLPLIQDNYSHYKKEKSKEPLMGIGQYQILHTFASSIEAGTEP